MDQNPETQAVESSLLNEWEIKFLSIFPQLHPQVLEGVGKKLQQVCAGISSAS
jgi:hypothetical protein